MGPSSCGRFVPTGVVRQSSCLLQACHKARNPIHRMDGRSPIPPPLGRAAEGHDRSLQGDRTHDRSTAPATQKGRQNSRRMGGGWRTARTNRESPRCTCGVSGTGSKTQVSNDGGTDPVWKTTGGELFYRNGDSMMAVLVSTVDRSLPADPRSCGKVTTRTE